MCKSVFNMSSNIFVLFFFRTEKIVAIVREEGYIVSRTHFEPHGLRTNALLSKLKEILTKKLSFVQDQGK